MRRNGFSYAFLKRICHRNFALSSLMIDTSLGRMLKGCRHLAEGKMK
jgi:hypothetical protein